MAASALESLAKRQGFHVDQVKLNLDWETVDYDYHPRLSGMTEFPLRLVPGAAAKLDDANSKLQAARVLPSSPHGAFAAVWSSPSRSIDDVAKALLTLPTRVPSNSLGQIGGLGRIVSIR